MLKKTVMLLAGVIVLSAFVAGNLQATDYAHELKDGKMTVAWSVMGDKLAVKMSADTEGWVGLGFNPTDQMKDANFILGYVKNGKAKIIDEFGNDTTKHTTDEKLGGTTDAELVGGTEEGGVTTIEFTVPLQSADKHDSVLDVNGDTIFLLAYGAGRDSFKSKHQYRATFKVNLSSGASEKM